MTSKEIIEKRMKLLLHDLLAEDNSYYYELQIKEYKQVLKDLEKLENIKFLVEKYNNDEMHFTRGFDFINVIKEVLENDK